MSEPGMWHGKRGLDTCAGVEKEISLGVLEGRRLWDGGGASKERRRDARIRARCKQESLRRALSLYRHFSKGTAPIRHKHAMEGPHLPPHYLAGQYISSHPSNHPTTDPFRFISEAAQSSTGRSKPQPTILRTFGRRKRVST